MQHQACIVEMQGIAKLSPVYMPWPAWISAAPGRTARAGGQERGREVHADDVLTGVYPFDAGEIVVRGQAYCQMTTTLSRQLGIACVHQHSQLVPPLSIAENVFCGSLAGDVVRPGGLAQGLRDDRRSAWASWAWRSTSAAR